LTVYLDDNNVPYTYGARTVYEVYIYTTTQGIDLIGQAYDCSKGGWVEIKDRRRAKRAARKIVHRRTPARVEAFPTPV